MVTSPAECCTPSLRSIYSWDEFFNIGAPYNTYAVYEDNRVYYTGCPKTRQKGYPVSVVTRLPNGNKTPAFTLILHHIKVHTRSAYHIQNTNSSIKLERKEQDVGLNLCLMTMCFISRISSHFSSMNMIRY